MDELKKYTFSKTYTYEFLSDSFGIALNCVRKGELNDKKFKLSCTVLSENDTGLKEVIGYWHSGGLNE